ncbi:MAG: aerobic carbon-monoxide dehydrogenase medium subunit [Methylobacteriaceae bacterium]|nr:aerobic carbon-monoxide dehydrogenase medium subunit [Methylobacteriaceae bacterium]
MTSQAETFAALQRYGEGAKLLAGGQSLVPALNLRLLSPAILIDINDVDELKGISLRANKLRIGALTRHAEIERAALIAEHAPLLKEAARHIAHPAIRNRGTMGGSLVNADPASELPACMVALGAEIVLASAAGERRVPGGDFFTGLYETAIAPGEILTAVEIPIARQNERYVFMELARRVGDYALVGIACQAEVVDNVLHDLKPAFFAVGTRPILASAAATRIIGRQIDAACLEEAAAALDEELAPINDLQASAAMRMHLARVLLRRAVAALLPELQHCLQTAARA